LGWYFIPVSQRFYFFESQTGISVDEAYRFLQNRWLEKQMQAKSRQGDDSNRECSGSSEQGQLINRSLLKKKPLNKTKIAKNNKKDQN
jgi:hypothetical protein